MNRDWGKIEKSKREERARLTGLPIVEKFRILDRMRERAVSIKAHKKRSIEEDRAEREKG
jgi:hypothetical protein